MNKFAEMTTFVSVVDARSFSEAARRLGTTKSQVSQRIQQLEKRLGRVLLNRTRPLSLTDPGRTYYEHACRLLQELEQAEASVLDADDDLRGQLRLSAPLAFTPRYLAPLLARFAERHPQLRGGRAGRRSFRQPPGTALRHGPAHGPAGRLLPGGAADHRQPPPALRQSRLPGAAWRAAASRGIAGARRAGLLQPRARRHALSAGGRRTGLVPHPGEDAHRLRAPVARRCARRARPGDPAELPGRRCLAGRRAAAGPAWLLAGRRAGFRGLPQDPADTAEDPRPRPVPRRGNRRSGALGPRAHRAWPVAAG
ncbi:LysR family transcriptional regulator [Pseudomonas aeruginosa]|nr:LysR family transcriptional regulator [Pseudomonas aeruginosa]